LERANPAKLQELLATRAPLSRARLAHHRKGIADQTSTAPCPKVKRCHCGSCQRCQEEARWDRIFNERFADPDYYKKRQPRFGSSMGWLPREREAM
jgi:hypothetical protein